jgi:YD repeat-containing protein
MNIKTLVLLSILFSCQSNEQKSNSNTADTLSNVKHDSSSYFQHNVPLDNRAFASLDSSGRASLKNDWNEMRLNGSVKSITEDLCLLREGSTEPDKPCKDHIVYQFNEIGFLVSKLRSTFDFGGQTEKYYYDTTSQHAIQIDMMCREDQVCSSKFCKYDDRGNMVEELHKRDGKDHWKYIYQFDKNDQMIGFEGFALNEDGHRSTAMTQTYDDRGNPLKQILIHKDDTTITTHRYKYDKLNRIVENVMNYNSTELNYSKTTVYKYNSSGQLVEEIEKGWPTLKITITYDQHGNWIRKLRKYQNSPSPSVDERTIEYF